MKFPKVDGPGEDIADALSLAEYDNVARDRPLTCEPAACFDQLDRVLDVNQYLSWLALMTFVDSGDHVDVGLVLRLRHDGARVPQRRAFKRRE